MYLKDTAGVSFARISLAAGLSRSAFRMIATGERVGEAQTLSAIAQATGSSLDWLIAGRGDPPTREQILAALASTGSDEADEEVA